MLANQVADSLSTGPITALATQMNWEKNTGVTNVTPVFIKHLPHAVYAVKTTFLLLSLHQYMLTVFVNYFLLNPPKLHCSI